MQKPACREVAAIRDLSSSGRNFSRMALQARKITRITLFIITGIGSGIGARLKPAITLHMKLIAAAGFWMLIIQPKLLLPADAMHLKMIGKLRIHKQLLLNLVITKASAGKAAVATTFLLKAPAGVYYLWR